jgi:SAM-dependent methyltransferase
MNVSRACDLCSHTRFEAISHRDRKGRLLETVACLRCGLVSHAHIPTDADLAAFYAHEYRREYHGEYTPSAHRVVREWQRGARLVDRLAGDLRPQSRVLEVGAGIGCNVKQFALAGFQASGIEPGEGFCRFSVDRLYASVTRGFLDDLPPGHDQDCVLLVHVLEHLASPTLALKQIRNLLTSHGRLYVEVPNLAGPHAAPGRQFHYAHIYNFTPATMRMLAGKTGYVVERVYTEPGQRNISMLWRVSSTACLHIEPASYAQTTAALGRYNTLTYHARPQYLWERAANLSAKLRHRWQAQAKLEAILAQCHGGQNNRSAVPNSRRAA